MSERMTDKRLAEIEDRRLNTPTGLMPDGVTLPPLPADSAISEELLQALKAERAQLAEIEALQRYECRAVKTKFGWFAEEQPDDDGDYVRVGGILAILAKYNK